MSEASANGDMKLMQFLIENGFPMNADNINNAMNEAAKSDQPESMGFILENVSRVDEESSYEALSTSCYNGYLDCVKLLVESGVDVNGGNGSYKADPLHSASEAGQLDVMDYLFEHNVDVNVRNADAEVDTALTDAIIDGEFDSVKLLVEHGADLEARGGDNKETELITASKWGSSHILEYLLEKGAKVNAQDNTGKTALMYAAQCNEIEIVKVLLKYNANVKTKDKKGQTALDLAKQSLNENVVKLLEKK
jgi:ankyrin repeat protein